jgi:hypothetical protein
VLDYIAHFKHLIPPTGFQYYTPFQSAFGHRKIFGSGDMTQVEFSLNDSNASRLIVDHYMASVEEPIELIPAVE